MKHPPPHHTEQNFSNVSLTSLCEERLNMNVINRFYILHMGQAEYCPLLKNRHSLGDHLATTTRLLVEHY